MHAMEAAMEAGLERVSSTTSSSTYARFPLRVTVSTAEESREVQADRDESVHGAIRRAFGAQSRIQQVLFTGATKALPDHPPSPGPHTP